MKVVAIVQSRLGSTRLPGKALMLLNGKPMIQHVIERAATIKCVDQVVLAVPDDDQFAYWAWPLNCWMFHGSEDDVLRRYAGAAQQYNADVIVRLTGDCPLLAPNIISTVLVFYLRRGAGYLPLCQPYCTVADGWDAEIFSREVLEMAQGNARPDEREHVVTWMRQHAQVIEHPIKGDWTALKCSVDTQEDFDRVEKVMAHLESPRHFSHYDTWQAWEKAGRP